MPLTEQEKEFVRTYKFTGGDLSIIYQRVLTHWSQFCVDAFVPLWVAPNLLTVLGLIVSLASVVITVYVHPSLGLGCPRWVGVMNGISIFAYQTLDAMDGKQVGLSFFV
jgi:ethanolaminephosphotransferase